MAIVDFAIEHIRAGRRIFPGIPNRKIPAIANPYEAATLDERVVLRWYKENPLYNICIPAGTEVEPGLFLGVIDFDSKSANGFETKDFLEDMGFLFPETLTQITPNHGEHMLYLFKHLIGNGAGHIGPGIDHRGFRGYFMGAGSWYEGKEYTFKNNSPVVRGPEWLAEKCRKGELRQRDLSADVPGRIDQSVATRQGRDFLARLGTTVKGERNNDAYKVAARLRGFGLEKQNTIELMSTDWKNEPPIEREELEAVVQSTFKTAKGIPGEESVLAGLTVIPKEKEVSGPKNPLDALNDEFQFITIGCDSRILWTDPENPEVRTLNIRAFHERLSNRPPIPINGKEQDISKVWMRWPGRKTYNGICFEPGEAPKNYYNTWKGFSVGKWAQGEKPTAKALNSVEVFKTHILKNVASGNEEHANWIFCWLADIFQNPGKKPRTALVLRGGKGIGKSKIFDCISKLIGKHYTSAANRRALVGNFNAHLEGKILYVLEEAFWTKDKNAEAVLKDLVTNDTLQIEKKGLEVYPCKNFCRVAILGNEEWVVPTSEDERRYAVFDVAPNNRNDDKFFAAFNEDMDHRVLYQFFMDFDLSLADINKIPKTAALRAQKDHSLDPMASWWKSCLSLGALGEAWPEQVVLKSTIRDLLREELRVEGHKNYAPGAIALGRFLKGVCPSLKTRRLRIGQSLVWAYDFPNLETARKEYDLHSGGETDWESIE